MEKIIIVEQDHCPTCGRKVDKRNHKILQAKKREYRASLRALRDRDFIAQQRFRPPAEAEPRLLICLVDGEEVGQIPIASGNSRRASAQWHTKRQAKLHLRRGAEEYIKQNGGKRIVFVTIPYTDDTQKTPE